MKVRELDHWPPRPNVVSGPTLHLPTPEEAIISRMIFCRDCWMTFVCDFEGNLFVYDFEADEKEVVGELKRLIDANVGKSLDSIGEIEL